MSLLQVFHGDWQKYSLKNNFKYLRFSKFYGSIFFKSLTS